jgi:hypothetical protein
MSAPAAMSRAAITEQLNAVLRGETTREAVAGWAARQLAAGETEIADPTTWQLLRLAASLELRSGPDRYLHAESDIRDWLSIYGLAE